MTTERKQELIERARLVLPTAEFEKYRNTIMNIETVQERNDAYLHEKYGN